MIWILSSSWFWHNTTIVILDLQEGEVGGLWRINAMAILWLDLGSSGEGFDLSGYYLPMGSGNKNTEY